MPYSIQKSEKPKGYFVINTETGKRYNKTVHKTKKAADAHLKALYTNTKDIEGSGIVSDLYENVKGRFSGVRYNYSPQIRKLLDQLGNLTIKNIAIYRSPVQSFVKKALNFISLGSFSKKLKELGFDEVFHLYIRVDLNNPNIAGGVSSLRIEKNHVITITPWNPANDEVPNKMNLIMPNDFWNSIGGLTLRQFLLNAENAMGQNYFSYNAFTNNCQVYIYQLLQQNKVLDINPQAKTFIFQDVQTLQTELPITSKISSGLTTLASVGDTLIYGQGLFHNLGI
jgi:hypothetical protein